MGRTGIERFESQGDTKSGGRSMLNDEELEMPEKEKQNQSGKPRPEEGQDDEEVTLNDEPGKKREASVCDPPG